MADCLLAWDARQRRTRRSADVGRIRELLVIEMRTDLGMDFESSMVSCETRERSNPRSGARPSRRASLPGPLVSRTGRCV